MRMLRAPGLALTAALLPLLVAGCNSADGDEPAPRPSTSSSPSASASPTESASTPVEPTLPAEAKEPTEAGARAFIAYYWELINYAQVTGDVAALARTSGPMCEGCNGGLQIIERLYGSGGYATGGAYDVEIDKLTRAEIAGTQEIAYQAALQVRNTEQVIVEGPEERSTQRPGRSDVLVYTLWVNDRWRMDVMDVQ
ncbi:hypothetical protein KG112_16615 [Nocardioides sp. zg-ZUI104]|uniref:DUF6318 family protein n=1 Tax=Nocardioides faecalis TaxID=2803858 RepID=UPI001BCA9CAF|nr:DUF6318 family protein [Nocardioides faecalis]MBS4754432.1 hypothetical protein [Nocardioides faecalis]